MTLHLSVQNLQLPQSVAELRILRRRIGRADRSVKPPEDLLKSVVVTLTVSARQICEAACSGFQQGRVLNKYLIAGVAMACPQLVRTLLFPCHGRLCAVDLDAESVFSSGRNLAGGHAASCAHSHAKDDSSKVFRIDRRFKVVFRPEQLIGKSFNRMFRLFSSLVERLQVGAQRLHPQPRDVLRHIKPV